MQNLGNIQVILYVEFFLTLCAADRNKKCSASGALSSPQYMYMMYTSRRGVATLSGIWICVSVDLIDVRLMFTLL